MEGEEHLPGVLERCFTNVYNARAVDLLLVMSDLDHEYSEGELAECASIPKDSISEVVSFLKHYKIADVSGEEPYRRVKLSGSGTINYLQKVVFDLAKSDIDSNSIEKGYDDAQKFI